MRSFCSETLSPAQRPEAPLGARLSPVLHQQTIDTTTPSGRAMFQMCGVFAEFERAMIVERVNSGLARAKTKGVKLGRGNKRSADEKRWGM
jgi:DNA invertase Pin-like site-specific DNA recombinase